MKTKTLLTFLFLVGLLLSACVQPATPTAAPSSTSAAPADSPTSPPAPTATVPPAPTALPSPTPTQTPVPVLPVKVTQIAMVDKAFGWAVGKVNGSPFDRVLQTSDGGVTWKDLSPSQPVSNPADANTAALAAFRDHDHAWVIYHSPQPSPASQDIVAWWTVDSGKTWQSSQTLQKPETMDFFLPTNLGFSDVQNGWLLAHLGVGMSHDYVALYKTADGGQTWTRVVDPSQEGVIKNSLPMSCQKTGVSFQDGLTGWVSGSCFGVVPGLFLYRTSDGGTTWSPVTLPAPAKGSNLFTDQQNVCTTQPALFSDQQVMIPISCQAQNGKNQGWLYASQDGGKTWKPLPLPEVYSVLTISPDGAIWALGGPSQDPTTLLTLYQSLDGGKTWTAQLEKMNWSGQLDFENSQFGWVVAKRADMIYLLKTEDGGKSWVEMKPVMAAGGS